MPKQSKKQSNILLKGLVSNFDTPQDAADKWQLKSVDLLYKWVNQKREVLELKDGGFVLINKHTTILK